MRKFDQRITEGILFTDQYQLAMAQLYFKMGMHEKTVQFDHFFRKYPDYGNHKAGYCINAGLEWLIDWMQDVRFRDNEIEFLRSHKTQSGRCVFDNDFLGWLKSDGSFENISLQAIPEGRVVHANVPLTVVQGPMAMAQILETALLNQLNYQTLIATKAARIHQMGKGQMLMEFGTRRGQDRGANAGVRAALIGGADFSSNVGISHVLGYPPKGTHSHSMVQFFLALGYSEEDAFRAFAELYPDNTILLVDTISTLESGVPNAIKVFEEMKRKGHKPLGIRLDSGDLAYLSIRAAQMLDSAGFENVRIVLSNQLDEMTIWQIITQVKEEAPKYGIDPDHLIKRYIYGVGTRLITSQGDAALGGVYKLSATYDAGKWQPVLKISETLEKVPNPGRKIAWRIYDKRNHATADLLTLENEVVATDRDIFLRHPTDSNQSRQIAAKTMSRIETLHENILDHGKLVYEFPSIEEIRKIRATDVKRLDPGIRRLINPHIYHVSLSQQLWDVKQQLIKAFKSER